MPHDYNIADPNGLNPGTGRPFSKLDELPPGLIDANQVVTLLRRMLMSIDIATDGREAKHRAHQEFIKILAEKKIMLPPNPKKVVNPEETKSPCQP